MRSSVAIVLAMALSGCVSPSEMLVSSDGRYTMRCAASGFGILGAPLAYRSVSNCVADYESIGYRKVKKDE